MKAKSTILAGRAVVVGVSYAIASRQGAVNEPDDSDWLYVDYDLAGTRYSYLKQFDSQHPTFFGKGAVPLQFNAYKIPLMCKARSGELKHYDLQRWEVKVPPSGASRSGRER
jgi:hypothetical protein